MDCIFQVITPPVLLVLAPVREPELVRVPELEPELVRELVRVPELVRELVRVQHKPQPS